MPSRSKHSQIGCGKVKNRIAEILAMIFTLTSVVCAQGMESPPITSFKPDTSLPKVNVPEFVITGKAQVDLPEPEKQSIEIDSSYFQGQNLQGIGIELPVNSFSNQGTGNAGNTSSLFARASIGSYVTALERAHGGRRDRYL